MSELDNEKNWWSSWVDAAKEKTSQTLQQVKHDLSEFTSVCSHDATTLVSNTSQVLQHSLEAEGSETTSSAVKKGITSLLGGISNVLTIPPDSDSQDDILRVTSAGSFEVFDKAKARLFELQSSAQTYCTEPDGDPSDFLEWKEKFDLDTRNREISELLVSVDQVRSIYTKLVPSAVSHSEFWHRYFYKVAELEKDEERKANLKDRAEKLKDDHKTEVTWDTDWDTDETVQASNTFGPLSLGSSSPADPVQFDEKLEANLPMSAAATAAPSGHVESLSPATVNNPDIHLLDESQQETNELHGGVEMAKLLEEETTDYVLVKVASTTPQPPSSGGLMADSNDQVEKIKVDEKSAIVRDETVGELEEKRKSDELSSDEWENWE